MSKAITLKDLIEKISYTKNETYTKNEVIEEIRKKGLLNTVSSLPTEDIEENKIYLVLNDTDEEKNKYNLFVYVDDDWEQIDKFNIDFEDFPTRSEVNYELSLKADTSHGHDSVTYSHDGFMTMEDKRKVDNIAEQTPSDDTPLMDSDGSAGVSSEFSRADHVHPSDTSKADSTHTHGKLGNDGILRKNNSPQGSKNVVTDSGGNITTEDKITNLSDLTNDCNFIEASDTVGLIRNDGTIDTNQYATMSDISGGSSVDLTNYIQKSQTTGLVKNDGSIDTKSYVESVNGKGLSANDFTDDLKEKLDVNFGYIDSDLKLHFVQVDEVTLSSTDDVLQSGDDVTVSANVVDIDEENVVDAPIDFYIDDVYYDTAITDSSGVASVEYTGTGTGEIDFSVKCGTVQSAPYSVCDAVFYDKALSGTGNHNDNWTSIGNLTRGATSTTFSPSGTYANSRIKINDSTDIPMGTYAIEVDISDVSKGTGDLRIGINDGTARNISLQNGHYLIEMKSDGKIYISVNGTAQTPISYTKTASTFTVGFYNTTDNSASFNFNDFRIYPI